jgi:hypothetical protein
MKESDQKDPDRHRAAWPQRLTPVERDVQHHRGRYQPTPPRNNIGHGATALDIGVTLPGYPADEVRNCVAAQDPSGECEHKRQDHDLRKPFLESRVSTGISTASTMCTISASSSG